MKKELKEKQCVTCYEVKPPTEFYPSQQTRVCKVCQRQTNRERYHDKLADNGGNNRIPTNPNIYADKIQKQNTFELLQLLGYLFNEELGIWTKEGWKELVDGQLHFPKMNLKGYKKRNDNRTPEHLILQIKELSSTLSIKEIVSKLGVSLTTAYKYRHA